MSAAKPVIFISYSHKDEPEHPRDGETAWLSFVRTYLQPAIKHGVFDLFVDRHLPGGADWDAETEAKIRACDIFILLVSAHSMASDIIVDKEIAIIRERQARGEPVHFYPLLLTPTPAAALDKVRDKNIRPRDAKPFSQFSPHDRMQHMTDAADEIAAIATGIGERKSAAATVVPPVRPTYVHISSLPETAYERLVGRDAELKRLDEAWLDSKTNIISLIAEGGAGKSALVNEWLTRMQADNYRGAEAVLGWSFYSQGTKERATSADGFLNWALERLSVVINTTSATAKGDAIAEALMHRRVLLVLDGVEPLQHGPDGQQGQLKDQGLRALLRRFAAASPAGAHGLIVLTSRLAVTDIAGRKDGAAPVIDVEKLSDEASTALLRDNSVWGTDKQLEQAARDFGGHPLALGLLASFLKETQTGDIRRRDHIRGLVIGTGNPGQDHAARVMESYEKEWLVGRPELLAIMRIIGLFDRPASTDCLKALRAEPAIIGLTDAIVALDENEWQRAIARLRDVRLIAPPDPIAPDSLDAHPLVREWFGERLEQQRRHSYRSGHRRLFEHLRDATQEGLYPTLEALTPLYQAITHGCRAGRHDEALKKIYRDRICRWRKNGELEYYSSRRLGANGSNLAAIFWFFEKPYKKPISTLGASRQSWILSQAAFGLRSQGRFSEALWAQRAAIEIGGPEWSRSAAVYTSDLSSLELILGNVKASVGIATLSVGSAIKSETPNRVIASLAAKGFTLLAAGRGNEAGIAFDDARRRQEVSQPERPLLHAIPGNRFCELLLSRADFDSAFRLTNEALDWDGLEPDLLVEALNTLNLARASLGSTFEKVSHQVGVSLPAGVRRIPEWFDKSVVGLRAAAQLDQIPRGLIGRAILGRCFGDWAGSTRDLEEVEDIARSGPMKLHLCDAALERARLALAKREGFAPLNGMFEALPPKSKVPEEIKRGSLHEEAMKQIAIAADYIEICGYQRRDGELAELQSVLRGERTFASLPIHV
ncbi:MAG TPA: TIR domain-containing protein [Rhizomicrobium sp.]|jgi:hypothetical protein|nr:TIR domain-containing protein [Rhizomicrobium sp.]